MKASRWRDKFFSSSIYRGKFRPNDLQSLWINEIRFFFFFSFFYSMFSNFIFCGLRMCIFISEFNTHIFFSTSRFPILSLSLFLLICVCVFLLKQISFILSFDVHIFKSYITVDNCTKRMFFPSFQVRPRSPYCGWAVAWVSYLSRWP